MSVYIGCPSGGARNINPTSYDDWASKEWCTDAGGTAGTLHAGRSVLARSAAAAGFPLGLLRQRCGAMWVTLNPKP